MDIWKTRRLVVIYFLKDGRIMNACLFPVTLQLSDSKFGSLFESRRFIPDIWGIVPFIQIGFLDHHQFSTFGGDHKAAQRKKPYRGSELDCKLGLQGNSLLHGIRCFWDYPWRNSECCRDKRWNEVSRARSWDTEPSSCLNRFAVHLCIIIKTEVGF